MGAMNTSSADVSIQIRFESCSSRSSGNWYRAWVCLRTRDGKPITFDTADLYVMDEMHFRLWLVNITATMFRLMADHGIRLPDFPECP